VICVRDFPRGEVSVKVGVMEFGLNCARLFVCCYVGLLDEIPDADNWITDILRSLP